MSLPGKKGRDLSQLPTLSYDIKLNLPLNVDSNPQEISFLDLVANDTKFKNDKEGLEFVLSSYVKACGKQSVKEILAERDTIVEDNASLSDIIRALMDYNDQQNANLGVGYNDPEDDDSFIDDSTAAQDIIPRNMTNERDGFYVNEKHQPIQARYLSEPSESDSEEDDADLDDSEDDDDESSDSEKEDKQNKKINNNQEDSNEKNAKKSKADDDSIPKVPNTKRKRSISEVGAPSLPINLGDKDKTLKPVEEPVKKVKKLSETTGEQCAQNFVSYVLPNEMDNDIKPSIEKLVKLILLDQTITNIQKKVERLFDPNICRELLDLVKKLHRHTNAHRQLVFDILSSKTGLSAHILTTRARLLLLNDYEPLMTSVSLNELKEKLRTEINRSLEFHVQAHDQAIKEWQQKMIENPSKDKNRGPRKNFRLHKTINELIIRCVDRRLESLTIFDTDSLELFLHDHIVPLWEKSGWMTAKKIISEVIRIEYRPLRDPNPPQNQSIQATRVTPSSSTTAERVKKEPQTIPQTSPSTAERVRKESQTIPQTSPKLLNPNPSPVINASKVLQQPNPKTHDIKSSNHSASTNNHGKSLEMATRVTTPNPTKQHTPRPASNESTTTNQLTEQSSHKTNKSDVIRPIAKPAIVSPSSQSSDSATKRNSTPNPATSSSAVIDFSLDLFSQYKKHANESLNMNSHSSSTSSNKDLSVSQRSASSSTSSVNQSKQQQQQQQQFATKVPSEKSPAGSFLKEALIGSASPKMTASPLAVDNMINKTLSSPKTNTNSSTMKPPPPPPPPPTTTTIPSPTNNSQRSSSSNKSTSNRPSTDFTHHRTDQQMQQQKPSSSSNRPSSTTPSSSSSASNSSASRRPATGFTSSHEQQSNRGHSSQVTIPSALPQSIQWDSATLQLAAAALANPQLLNSSIFDPSLLNSVFATAANMVSSSQSPSSSSSRQQQQQQQQHSQNTNNNRRT